MFEQLNTLQSASRMTLVRAIKANWCCEQGHQQMKDELGLDHFEVRSWLGLHHHALMTMIAFAFLLHRCHNCVKQAGEKTCSHHSGTTAAALSARSTGRHHRDTLPANLHAVPSSRHHSSRASA